MPSAAVSDTLRQPWHNSRPTGARCRALRALLKPTPLAKGCRPGLPAPASRYACPWRSSQATNASAFVPAIRFASGWHKGARARVAALSAWSLPALRPSPAALATLGDSGNRQPYGQAQHFLSATAGEQLRLTTGLGATSEPLAWGTMPPPPLAARLQPSARTSVRH